MRSTQTPFGLGALFFLIFCKVSVSSISVCFLFFKAFDSAFDVIPYMLLLFVFFLLVSYLCTWIIKMHSPQVHISFFIFNIYFICLPLIFILNATLHD